MRRKAYMIGILAAGLIATSLHVGPSYCRVIRSAQNFQEVFQSLDEAKADLNSLERLVFSLMLTGKGAGETTGKSPAPVRGAA